MPCIFCRSNQDLTEEHLFPAFCGGVLGVLDASCSVCNRDRCGRFEDRIARETRTLRNILEIANRYGKAPNCQVTFELDQVKIPATRRADGEIILRDFVTEIPLGDGRKRRRGFFIDPAPAVKFSESARRRGEKVNDIPMLRDVSIVPVSQQTLQFAFAHTARRLAAKTALVALAYKYGVEFSLHSQFDKLREAIFGPFDKLPVRIFANEEFANNQLRTPHQHSVVTYLSAGLHKGWSVVTMFGGLSYVVQLTEDFQEPHSSSFSIHYDADTKREYNPVILLDEYNLIGRVLSDVTQFEVLEGVDEQWYRIIAAYCKARGGIDIFRTPPDAPET